MEELIRLEKQTKIRPSPEIDAYMKVVLLSSDMTCALSVDPVYNILRLCMMIFAGIICW